MSLITLDTYLNLPRDHNLWVLKPLIPISGKGLLYSPAKVGKSSLAIQLAQAVSGDAQDFLGFPVVTHGRVLYIQIDTPRATWADRFVTPRKKGKGLTSETLRILDT